MNKNIKISKTSELINFIQLYNDPPLDKNHKELLGKIIEKTKTSN